MNDAAFVTTLRAAGLVTSPSPRFTPLNGGVSSDIFLVDDDGRQFVVKRALAKLRVRDDWFADVGRNGAEQAYFRYAGRIVPDAVPRLLHASRDGWFAMEYCGAGWRTWKSELLAGRFDPGCARRAGEVLGRIHAASWGDPVARDRFDTLENFTALRIDPYFETAAQRVPPLSAGLRAMAERLAATRFALVHGDYSPKNLLVSRAAGFGDPALQGHDRLLVLDAEVAWFGDPAFDVAFLVHHLLLKALVHAGRAEACLALITEAWSSYAAALGGHATPELEQRAVTLALGMMLARIHGKSPVEYLKPPQQETVTTFVVRQFPQPPASVAALGAAWSATLRPSSP